jgi:hypothetical protein
MISGWWLAPPPSKSSLSSTNKKAQPLVGLGLYWVTSDERRSRATAHYGELFRSRFAPTPGHSTFRTRSSTQNSHVGQLPTASVQPARFETSTPDLEWP